MYLSTYIQLHLFVQLSLNMVEVALLELEFLKLVDELQYLYQRDVIHRAVYRLVATLRKPLEICWKNFQF